jgi:hypothetical protein
MRAIVAPANGATVADGLHTEQAAGPTLTPWVCLPSAWI